MVVGRSRDSEHQKKEQATQEGRVSYLSTASLCLLLSKLDEQTGTVLGVESRASGEKERFRIFEPTASKVKRRACLYYCGLCDEVLAFSEDPVDPLKVRLVYGDNCPGCGFELERALCSEAYDFPDTINLFNTSLRKQDFRAASRTADGGRLQTHGFSQDMSTGIETIDGILELGRLVVLTGPTGHALSLLLCVKAQLPDPLGPDSHVVWIDGGNLFDPAEISSYAVDNQIDLDKVARRIRLSRAFTYHQLSTLTTRTLPSEMERVRAKVAVVSDMTRLYCDPDIRDKGDALDTFKRDIRFLRELAAKKNVLVVVTILRPRNHVIESFLHKASHPYGQGLLSSRVELSLQ